MLSCFVLNVSVNEVYRSGVGVWEGERYVLPGTLGPAFVLFLLLLQRGNWIIPREVPQTSCDAISITVRQRFLTVLMSISP